MWAAKAPLAHGILSQAYKTSFMLTSNLPRHLRTYKRGFEREGRLARGGQLGGKRGRRTAPSLRVSGIKKYHSTPSHSILPL